MASASTIRIIAIVITFVLVAQCVPNIIYYSMIAYSGSFSGTNKGIAMFMMYFNIILIVVGLGIIIYLLVSGLSKEKETIEQPRYIQRPEAKENETTPTGEHQPEKEEIMNIRGLGDPMISKEEAESLDQSLLFSE